MPSEPDSLSTSRRGPAIAAAFGLPIGVLSGFAGVGGGEYRAPVLLGLFGDVRRSIAANLLIGAVVSGANFLYRSGWTRPGDELILAVLLIATSVPGAYVGAALTRRTTSRVLKAFLAAILIVTGLRLILVEATTGPPLRLDASAAALALAFGFGLGLISGVLGLAAGEYRIPALILIFGVGPVVAGTLSSLAAIPQQAIAFAKHRALGHVYRATYRIGGVMTIASVLGVLLGVGLLGRTTEALVAQVLGVAMIVAASFIIREIPRPRETSS